MKYVSLMLLTALLAACAPKFYEKKQYSFYDGEFQLPAGAAPRTDGVYITARVWSEQQQKTVRLKEKVMYRFYPGGQYNLFLNLYEQLDTEQDYLTAIQKHYEKKGATLFEGYYRLQNNRIILQGLMNRPKQFTYKYGRISRDSLIIVKGGGNGKFREENFTELISEPYEFIPLDTAELNKYPAYW